MRWMLLCCNSNQFRSKFLPAVAYLQQNMAIGFEWNFQSQT